VADVTIKSQLEGLAKEVYGEGPENLIPDHAKLLKEIPFRESEMLGNAYNVPVVVSDENGVTYAGSEDDAFSLNDPEAMQTKTARVKGSQIVMRCAIGYKAAAAIASKGKKAFLNSTEYVIKRLMEQAGKRIELSLLYGASGLGQINDTTNASATSTVLSFTTASWAAGIWVGSKNSNLDIYDSTAALLNSVGPIKVVSVDVPNKKITVSADPSDITAIDAATIDGSHLANLFFFGAKGKEMLGIDSIITTSGQLFEIDNTVYDLFKGRTFDCGSAGLSFDKLSKAMVELVNFGLDGKVKVLVNPLTWQNLNQNEAALRNYDFSYKPATGEKGNESLVYHSQNGAMEIEAHAFVKQGEGFILPMDALKRVGAYDLSMRNPGRNNEMFRELDGRSGFEIRAYTDQAIFTDHPSRLLKLTGIVNS